MAAKIVSIILISSVAGLFTTCYAVNSAQNAHALLKYLQKSIINGIPTDEVQIPISVWEGASEEYSKWTPEYLARVRGKDHLALLVDQVIVPFRAAYEDYKLMYPDYVDKFLILLIDNFKKYSPIYQKEAYEEVIVKHPKTFKLWTALMAEVEQGKTDTDITFRDIKFAYDEYNVYRERKDKELLGIAANGGTYLNTDDILHNANEYRSLASFTELPQVQILRYTIYATLDVAKRENRPELKNAENLVKQFKQVYKLYKSEFEGDFDDDFEDDRKEN